MSGNTNGAANRSRTPTGDAASEGGTGNGIDVSSVLVSVSTLTSESSVYASMVMNTVNGQVFQAKKFIVKRSEMGSDQPFAIAVMEALNVPPEGRVRFWEEHGELARKTLNKKRSNTCAHVRKAIKNHDGE